MEEYRLCPRRPRLVGLYPDDGLHKDSHLVFRDMKGEVEKDREGGIQRSKICSTDSKST
jgi:hypothetical protein